MEGIVCISGTNRPDNETAHALGIVVEAFRHSHIDPLVFDARPLSLAFPGHPDPGDGERLRTAIAAAPGVVLAAPAYHGSFGAMTKRIIENLGFPSVLAGKPVALVGMAAGHIGAIKALEHLKSVCAHIGAIVVPGAVSVAGVQQVGRVSDVYFTIIHAMLMPSSEGERHDTHSCALPSLSHRLDHEGWQDQSAHLKHDQKRQSDMGLETARYSQIVGDHQGSAYQRRRA